MNDIEGLHVDVVFPFNLDDYLLGAKFAVGNAVKFPDTLFAKKSFDVADGSYRWMPNSNLQIIKYLLHPSGKV